MNVLDTRLCLWLHSLPSLGDMSLARLIRHYGSVGKIRDSDPSEWRELGVAARAIAAARARPADVLIDRQLATLQQLDAEVLTLADERYPALLRTLYDPPPILYVRGNPEVLQEAQLGVVGSRKATPQGVRAARELSAALVSAGLHIVSGLAMGVDQAAHLGALEAEGKTIAVMATGLDVIYPRRHRGLAEQVAASGALLTEFPPGCEPLPERFPKRNRIISGLALGVLVVEAALRSGSLITARTAMEQGREVFALPWSMYHRGGKGCLSLIRDGVCMVQGVEDILEELGPLYQCQREMQHGVNGRTEDAHDDGAPEAAILDLMSGDALSIDEIIAHSGMEAGEVLPLLTRLEMQRLISRCAGGYLRC